MSHKVWYIVGGLVALIGGIAALTNLFAASIAATALAGYLFIIAGAFQIFGAFSPPRHGHRVAQSLFGLISIVLGLWLLIDPMEGMLSLTFAIAILLILSGGTRAVAAFSYRSSAKVILLISALVAIGLGILILISYPVSAMAVLGLYLGIELVFIGAALLTIGMPGHDPLTVKPL